MLEHHIDNSNLLIAGLDEAGVVRLIYTSWVYQSRSYH